MNHRTTPPHPTPLPKGVTLVTSGYRVRIRKKNNSIDKVLKTYEEVKRLLNITEENDKEELKKSTTDKIYRIIFNNLSFELEQYLFNKYKVKDLEQAEKLEDKKRRQFKAEYSRLKTIINTEIFYNEELEKFGDLNHFKLKRIHFIAYCEARDKSTVAEETIKREISFLRGYYKNLLNSSRGAEAYSNNILENFSYTFKNAKKRKEKERLTDEQEQDLFNSLRINEDMFNISAIALLTGMRKSEVIFLRQDQIFKEYILLSKEDTKTNKKRLIYINEEVKQILNKYKDKKNRLFKYSINGFNANFKRALKRAGLTNVISFHNLRVEFVSRILSLELNDSQKQQLARLSSAKYFKTQYIDKKEELKAPTTPDEVAKQAGHSLEVMNSIYLKSKK